MHFKHDVDYVTVQLTERTKAMQAVVSRGLLCSLSIGFQ